MKKLVIITLLLAFVAGTAWARCMSSYVCDGYGMNCRYMDVCDNTFDTPSTNVPPIPAIPTYEVKPLPSLDLPPIGTSRCRYMQVNGHWQNICY